uniref:E3 ubiquitin-protein ligase synoviolin-like TPR repeats domain-containing protein n=1 Tax=Rhodnius prolixus TaxID=13249 RepID=T1I603_RHOPR
MRNLAITVMSMILTTVVIGNAYYQKKQFYPSVVYITKSNPSMAVAIQIRGVLGHFTGLLLKTMLCTKDLGKNVSKTTGGQLDDCMWHKQS